MPDVRLIDANALKANFDDIMVFGVVDTDGRITPVVEYRTVVELIDWMPTDDAQPVKHGKWVRDASGELNCSYCGYAPKWDDDKFCANCGAKMDGGDSDA